MIGPEPGSAVRLGAGPGQLRVWGFSVRRARRAGRHRRPLRVGAQDAGVTEVENRADGLLYLWGRAEDLVEVAIPPPRSMQASRCSYWVSVR